jgi:hypothetical protein
LDATLRIKHEKNHSNILSIVFAVAGLISPLIFAANIAAGKIKFVICYLLFVERALAAMVFLCSP